MKLFNVIKKITHIPHKIVSAKAKHSAKKFKGILLCGKTLHSISKEADITIEGIMLFNYMAFASKSKRYEVGRILIEKGAKLLCDSGVTFRAGCKLGVYNGAELILGKNISLNYNTTLYCRSKIVIGNDTAISQNVVIRDSDVHHIKGTNNSAPIIIGNHCWIGTNVIILKGVSIGDNSVVGAGSVVTHDIPPNCAVAGNPARIIKENIDWEF